MVVKDRIVSWFIQNIILPKHEVMDKPGFLITRVTDKHMTVSVRELFLPESFFENLEKRVVESYGDEGRQRLYSIGKKFGYTYSALSHFPVRSQNSQKDFEKSCYLLIRYISCMYAHEIKEAIHYADKEIDFAMDGFVICRNNGIGHIMTEGGIAGIWSYLNEDKTIEAAQTSCQGRGDKTCKVIAAPAKLLRSKKLKFYTCEELRSPEYADYNKFNDIRPLKSAKNSLQQLINMGFFSYKKGSVEYNKDRYFLADSSIIYTLEDEIGKLKNGLDILFQAAFDFGKSLSESRSDDYRGFIADFFPALGWGGIMATSEGGKVKVYAECFPWLENYAQHKYIVFRGMLSGALSGFLNREVLLLDYKGYIQNNSLNIVASER